MPLLFFALFARSSWGVPQKGYRRVGTRRRLASVADEGARGSGGGGRLRQVIHRIHSEVGRKVTGPGERERPPAVEQAQAVPPGHFLSDELESDCARFLEDVRTLVRRREQDTVALRLGSRP